MSTLEKPQQHAAAVTDYVAAFVTGTSSPDIPKDVAHLGKRSVLDGIGLALAGAASHQGGISRAYLENLGIGNANGSTVIGSSLRLPARFAAFANGLAIHADDYDDTQLAVAKDRVYGLLTHPTAPALPPALALAERDRRSRRATTSMDSTAPRPAAPSARPPVPRSCSASIAKPRAARSRSVPRRRAGCARTSAP